MPEMQGQRVTVMGLGRFGGGAGATRWLVERQSASVLLTDLADPGELQEPLESIHELIESGKVTLRLGEHQIRDFVECDLIVANPAVPHPWDNPYLRAAQEAHVPVTTEMRLLTEVLPNRNRTIGVTGTAGKSTTAAMVHHILNACGRRAHLGGNIGGSLLGNDISDDDWVMLELSSAMLYWLGKGVGSVDARGWSPHVGVVTNIAPNHLDWHGPHAHYENSKRNIARYQQTNELVVAGSDSAESLLSGMPGRVQTVDDSLMPDLAIPGEHNLINARTAIEAACQAAHVDRAEAARSLRTFPGLPHRLQLVHETIDGRRFFNDSKATTPEATLLAINAFGPEARGRIHLIAGGYDKGIDLSAISRAAEELAGLYTIGATGQAITELTDSSTDAACFVDNLDAAVARAFVRMRSGDILLLSPGCASWDQYSNFEKRGARFAKIVCGLVGGDADRNCGQD